MGVHYLASHYIDTNRCRLFFSFSVQCILIAAYLLRAGVTPFLAAHLHGYNNFKWMLYGDDDTVFFIDNALDMLEELDHNMPYFLTDHLWFPDQFGKALLAPQMPACMPFVRVLSSPLAEH